MTWRESDGKEVPLRAKITHGGANIFEEAGKAGEGWGYNPGKTAFKPDLEQYPPEWRKAFEEEE